MKISRWIITPLYCAVAYAVLFYLFGVTENFTDSIIMFVIGALFGFSMQAWSDVRARFNTNRNDKEIYQVRQNKKFTVLMNFEKAFELCKEVLVVNLKSKIKKEFFNEGIIVARTKRTWDSSGNFIEIKLNEITQNLTEIEILTRPISRTALLDYGEGWKYINEISKFLMEKDFEMNKKVLKDSSELLDEIYINPFKNKDKNYSKTSSKAE